MRYVWTDRHVLVTGGSEGIGAAVAEEAVRRGARVTILARREEPLRAHAAATGAHPVAADVTDSVAVAAAVADAVAANGPIDVLVHCAGTALPGRFLEVDPAEFRTQIELNHLGAVTVLRAVLPDMVTRRRGRVVLTSSTAALLGVPGYTAYGASKAAVAALAAALRHEVEPAGVRITVLYPPDTKTPGFDAENLRKPPETAAISGGVRPVDPETVARAVIRGVERGSRTVTVDALTAALLRFGGVMEPVMRPVIRRIAAKARGR